MLKPLMIASTLLVATGCGANNPAGPPADLQRVAVNPATLDEPAFTVSPPDVDVIPVTGEYVIRENNNVYALDCDGANVEVRGNGNTIYLYGECDNLRVLGNDNTILVNAVDDIEARGNGNRVVFDTDAPETTILDPGNDNLFVDDWELDDAEEVAADPGSLPAPDFDVELPGDLDRVTVTGMYEIRENNQTLALDCNGADVAVLGNDNTVYLYGECDDLILRGNSNTVYANELDDIEARGNNNRVVFDTDFEEANLISAPGNNNVFVHDWDAD